MINYCQDGANTRKRCALTLRKQITRSQNRNDFTTAADDRSCRAAAVVVVITSRQTTDAFAAAPAAVAAYTVNATAVTTTTTITTSTTFYVTTEQTVDAATVFATETTDQHSHKSRDGRTTVVSSAKSRVGLLAGHCSTLATVMTGVTITMTV